MTGIVVRGEYGMVVHGQRGHGEKLTEAERYAMQRDMIEGLDAYTIAVKYRCSSRVVTKYRAQWFGGSGHGGARHRTVYTKRPKVCAVVVKAIPEPHVCAGITKAMLMAGNGRVARRREVSDVG